MNVLFATTDYIKKGKPTTGFPTYLYRVSQALLKLGHTPIILVIGTNDSYKVNDGVEIYTVQISETCVNNNCVKYLCDSIKKSWVINKKIKEIIRRRKIDIIQFTSLNGIALFYRENIPAVLRLSSYAKTSFQTYGTYNKHFVHLMALIEIVSSRRCNAIFAPCQLTANYFRKDSHRKVYVIESPFVNDVEQEDKEIYEKALSNKKYFLFFGSLYIEKGIMVIGEILERLLEQYSDYYFVFVGKNMVINGEPASMILKRKAGRYQNRIIILDAMPHERLYPIIQNADLVILPSLMDNFPNACVEAMYFSKIVIGTDGASFEQLITDKENGLLCRPGDSMDLYSKIEYAMNLSEVQKRQMEEKAHRRIYYLKPEIVVRKLVNFYKKVIDCVK